MPDCWAKDQGRREKAGIPEGLSFATKPELAIAQVRRLVAGGLRVLWAAADEVYGRSGEFRAALRGLGLSYVVIIPCDYQVTFARNKVTRADQAVSEAVFEQRSAGNGTKGPRYADWALLGTKDPGELLLIRRLPDRGKNQYTYYLCHAAEGRPATLTYFHHHSGKPLASGNYFPDRERRLRLGPVPGPHLERDLPAHRPDRPRPAAHRRRPGRPHRMPRPPRGSAGSPRHRSRSGGTGREPR
jgi:hypothetical protein